MQVYQGKDFFFLIKNYYSQRHNQSLKTSRPKAVPYSGSHSSSIKSARGDRSKSPLISSIQKSSPSPRPKAPVDSSKAKTLARKSQVDQTDEEYSHFLKLVGTTPGIRPKRMNAQIQIQSIEDIYTARFLKDTSYFKAQIRKGGSEEISDKPFPNFISEFFKKKFKNNKKQIQQGCQDLVSSLEYHRKEMIEADLFANFLTQKYDTRDLVFFLYTRCLLEKELDIKFSAYGKVSPIKTVDPRTLTLSMKTCRKISTIFFEEDEGELNNFLNSVQAKIDENTEATGEKRIQSTAFLILLLDEFHASKDTSGMQKSIGVMDNPFADHKSDYHKKEENKRKAHSSGKLIS